MKDAQPERRRGKILTLHEGGYGFIEDPQAAGGERFFHRSAFRGEFDLLAPGDVVEFEGIVTQKGDRAVKVERVEEAGG